MQDDMEPFKRWLKSSLLRDRRKADRRDAPGVVAHYWDGACPVEHTIRDISRNGVYLLTEQRWYPGTMILLTLQRKNAFDDDANRSITVQARVVRSGRDGVGLAFAPYQEIRPQHGRGAAEEFQMKTAPQKEISGFVERLRNGNGQSLVEYILVLPVIFLLIVNLVNFGAFFYAWITVSNAARAGADYAILGAISAGAPSTPNGTLVSNLITTDLLSLPNRSSAVINVCKNANGTTITLAGTCTSPGSDTEPANFVATTIDVTYTYQPLIPAGFQFANLNVYATIPPTTIHRRAVMRSMGGAGS